MKKVSKKEQEALNKQYEEYRQTQIAKGSGINSVPSFEDWRDFYRASPKLVKAYARMLERKGFNKEIRKAHSNKVFDVMTGLYEDMNPVYLRRNEATKDLRKKLTAYSGSPEFASDELFRLKKLADEKGEDFGDAAAEQVDQMKGKHIESEATAVELEVPQDTEPLRFCKWCLPKCRGHKRYKDEEELKPTWLERIFKKKGKT